MVFLIIVVLGGIFLLVAAWVLAQQNNPSSPAGGVQTEDPEAGGGRISTPEVSRISLADAKAAFDSGTAFFLDVRSAESFAASHILGAYNIPLAELPQRMGELNPADWIITYCT